MEAIDAVEAAREDEDEDDGAALRDALAERELAGTVAVRAMRGAKQKRARIGTAAPAGAGAGADDDDLRLRQVEALESLARVAETALPLLVRLVCSASSPTLICCSAALSSGDSSVTTSAGDMGEMSNRGGKLP